MHARAAFVAAVLPQLSQYTYIYTCKYMHTYMHVNCAYTHVPIIESLGNWSKVWMQATLTACAGTLKWAQISFDTCPLTGERRRGEKIFTRGMLTFVNLFRDVHMQWIIMNDRSMAYELRVMELCMVHVRARRPWMHIVVDACINCYTIITKPRVREYIRQIKINRSMQSYLKHIYNINRHQSHAWTWIYRLNRGACKCKLSN